MALRVTNVEHFHKVLEELAEQPDFDQLHKAFEKQVKYLHHYNPKMFDVEVGYDMAKWSFSIYWVKKGKNEVYMNGGLIYHPGAREADRSLSVELNYDSEPHWSVHT